MGRGKRQQLEYKQTQGQNRRKTSETSKQNIDLKRDKEIANQASTSSGTQN